MGRLGNWGPYNNTWKLHYSIPNPPFSNSPFPNSPFLNPPPNIPSLNPIVTPNRVEYSSITDEIDTCLATPHTSPPDTPPLYNLPTGLWTSHEKDPRKRMKKKKRDGGKGGKSGWGDGGKGKGSKNAERLKEMEEDISEQLKPVVRRRMRQMSLTETDEYANLAKHGLEAIETLENGDFASSIAELLTSGHRGSRGLLGVAGKMDKCSSSENLRRAVVGGMDGGEGHEADSPFKHRSKILSQAIKGIKDNLVSLEGYREDDDDPSPVAAMASITALAASIGAPHRPTTPHREPIMPQKSITSDSFPQGEEPEMIDSSPVGEGAEEMVMFELGKFGGGEGRRDCKTSKM